MDYLPQIWTMLRGCGSGKRSSKFAKPFPAEMRLLAPTAKPLVPDPLRLPDEQQQTADVAVDAKVVEVTLDAPRERGMLHLDGLMSMAATPVRDGLNGPSDHIGSSRCRPVLIIDEAQEALTTVLCELRILASKELDSKQLLCVVFAGDARLPERLRSPELLPLGSRIRRRLALDYASRDELLACLDHLLAAAGNQSLMTSELRVTLADHAAGNFRVLMNLADELLAVAADRELPRLDEKLFLEVFAQAPKPKPPATTRKR